MVTLALLVPSVPTAHHLMKQSAAVKEFKDSNSPYICARCQKVAYMETIDETKDTIAALKAEVSELRTTLVTILSTEQQRE